MSEMRTLGEFIVEKQSDFPMQAVIYHPFCRLFDLLQKLLTVRSTRLA